MTPDVFRLTNQTRRHLLQTAGLGIGSMALQSLLANDKTAGADAAIESSKSPRAPMLAPRAKRVIYLHMAGSPSQLELFEHKPDLQKLHMQDCPASFLEGKRFAFIKGVPKILAGQFSFAQYGESGQWISELLPHFASVVDKAAVIRTVQTEQFNHAPFSCLFTQGRLASAIRRWVHGSIMAWEVSTRTCQASSCSCQEERRRMQESRCGAPDFCLRFIREFSVVQLAIQYCT